MKIVPHDPPGRKLPSDESHGTEQPGAKSTKGRNKKNKLNHLPNGPGQPVAPSSAKPAEPTMIRAWEYDMSGQAKQCVERYLELSRQKESHL